MTTDHEKVILLARLASEAMKSLLIATGDPSDNIEDGDRVTRGVTAVFISGILMGLECAAQNAPEARERIDAAADIYIKIAAIGGLRFTRPTETPR